MQQLMLSFPGLTPPADILDAVRAGRVSSFCLFAHMNVQSPAQVRELTLALRRAAAEGGHPPPLIGIDQEGGQLVAIGAGATELPGNMALGATRSPELAAAAGRVLGRELLAMGINLNFAPSLDVNVNPANPVIGTRAFGDTAALVASLGGAMIGAMQAEGVLAAAKHFPGHGDTDVDSHHAVPTNDQPLSRLHEVELMPFRAAIDAGAGAMMTAHIVFSSLDPDLPATLSAAVVRDLLRRDMGYDGLIITDAMDMYPAARYGGEAGVVRGLRAGNDLALLAHLPEQLRLVRALAGSEDADSLRRIGRARQAARTALPPLDVVGCDEHRRIAQEIADRAITRVRDDGRLPLRPGAGESVALIAVTPVDLTPADTSGAVRLRLADAIRHRHANTRVINLAYGADEAGLRSALDAAREADHVIVATIAASADPAQAALVNALLAREQAPIVVALRTPYDIMAFPGVGTYLCAYSVRAESCEAIARVVFGEIRPTGILPCTIPGIEQTGIAV